MKIDFNTKSAYGDGDDKFIKTRINTTNFHNKNGSKKLPEEKVPHKCLSIIILHSVIYAYEKYHPQTFFNNVIMLKKKKKKKTNNYIDKELESESDTDSDSDNGIYIDSDNEE